MKDYKKYGRARDQIYHYIVLQDAMHRSIPAAHRTAELVQLLEMCELIAQQVKEAFEADQVLAMQLDRYDLVPLPGFEDIMNETENPYKRRD